MSHFKEHQLVNTPKGKAWVDEHYHAHGIDVVSIELASNGVEMEFPADQVQDWEEFQRAQNKPKETFVKPRDKLAARMAMGEVLLKIMFKDDPEGYKVFTKMAGNLLLEHCRAVISAYEKEHDKPDK